MDCEPPLSLFPLLYSPFQRQHSFFIQPHVRPLGKYINLYRSHETDFQDALYPTRLHYYISFKGKDISHISRVHFVFQSWQC